METSGPRSQQSRRCSLRWSPRRHLRRFQDCPTSRRVRSPQAPHLLLSPPAANSSLILSSAILTDASSECCGPMITLLFASFKMYVYRYDVNTHLIEPNLSLGKECFESNISNCAFWGNGVVCITEANDTFYIADFKNPIAVKLADPGLLEPPRCIAVIEPQYTVSGNIEVLLGVGDGSEEDDAAVLAIEEDGVQRLGVGML